MLNAEAHFIIHHSSFIIHHLGARKCEGTGRPCQIIIQGGAGL